MREMITEQKLMIVRETAAETTRTRTPADIAGLWESEIKKSAWYQEDKECCVVFFLNSKNYMTGYNLVSLGTLDASLVHPREVFRPAIIGGAAAIVLAHNHPSGDPMPSMEDIRITKQMVEVGKIVDIKCLDHVVIGKAGIDGKGFYSMRESGIVEFGC